MKVAYLLSEDIKDNHGITMPFSGIAEVNCLNTGSWMDVFITKGETGEDVITTIETERYLTFSDNYNTVYIALTPAEFDKVMWKALGESYIDLTGYGSRTIANPQIDSTDDLNAILKFFVRHDSTDEETQEFIQMAKSVLESANNDNTDDPIKRAVDAMCGR